MNYLQSVPRAGTPAKNAKAAGPVVRLPPERNWFDTIPGERLAIVVHSKDVGGRFSIYESVASPGAGTPMHYHAEDEIFYLLEGVLTFSADGKIIEAHPGTTVVVPGGCRHAWRNRQDRPARALVGTVPGGLEDLFLQLRGSDPEQLAKIAEEYGSYIVGPGIGD